ncbi:MAG: hypothetical protein ACI4R9_03425 [Kiritimatiellia bacterium]
MQPGVALLLALAAPAANAWIWQNLNKESGPLAGDAVRERDLIGKVVLVCCLSSQECDVSRLVRAQELLEANDRTKFAVIGASLDRTCDAELLRRHKITFPVYESGSVPCTYGKPANAMYFLDEYGRQIWQSRDAASQRDLEQALAATLARVGEPPSLTEGVTFVHYRTLREQLVYGRNLAQLEAQLAKDAAAGHRATADAAAKERAAEAQQILDAMGRGMERMMKDVRTLADIDRKRAYRFLDLHLKSFPRDKEKYAEFYADLERRAK